MTDEPYHHGDLPTALLRAVGELVEEGGVGAVSVRAVARRAGVSHAAPAHHFGDRGGLLAAYAAEGFGQFHDQVVAAVAALGPEATAADAVRATGAAYVTFGFGQPGRYAVMFRKELVDCDDPHLQAAGGRAFEALLAMHRACLDEQATDADVLQLSIAAWSIVHGFVSLHNDMPAEAPSVPPLAPFAESVLEVHLAGARAHPHWVGDDVAASAIDEDLRDPLVAAA